MRATVLDRQVTFYKKEVTQDTTYGTDVVAWVPLAYESGSSPQVAQKFWADVEPVLPSRSEAVRQGLSVARDLVNLRMRWRDDVTSAMQVVVHGPTDVTYEIVAGPVEVVEQGRRRWMEMALEKFTTSGTVV